MELRKLFLVASFLQLTTIFVVIKALQEENKNCFEDSEIFLQLNHSQVSGWYIRNNKYDCSFSKNFSLISNEIYYEFFRIRDEWYLYQWDNFRDTYKSKYLLYELQATLPDLLHTKSTNFYCGFPNSQAWPLDLESEVAEGENDKLSRKNNYDKINIYLPKKCRCRTILAGSHPNNTLVQFKRLDLFEYIEQCKNLQDIYDLLPDEYKSLLDNVSYSNRNEKFSENFTMQAAATATNFKDVNKWIPEFYVSNSCAIIFFDPINAKWIADYLTDNKCNPYESIDIFTSKVSAPCIEYLPPSCEQTWASFQPVFLTQENDTHYEKHCGGLFESYDSPYFSVYCSEMDAE